MLVDLGRVDLDASLEINLLYQYQFFHNWIIFQLHKGRSWAIIGKRLGKVVWITEGNRVNLCIRNRMTNKMNNN